MNQEAKACLEVVLVDPQLSLLDEATLDCAQGKTKITFLHDVVDPRFRSKSTTLSKKVHLHLCLEVQQGIGLYLYHDVVSMSKVTTRSIRRDICRCVLQMEMTHKVKSPQELIGQASSLRAKP